MTERSIAMPLKCVLTDREKLERGERAAEIEMKINVEEEEYREVRKEYREKLKGLKAERYLLLDEIRNGEERPVECTVREDYARDMVMVVRNDTGEVVEERPMTAEDRQQRLAV